jgi:RNA polymerase sigma-70 factor (ECF subfamily)
LKGTDRDARLGDWLRRHRGLLVKVTRSFARTPQDRDDLLQEIAFQVWESIPRYTAEVAESTWLYRVAFYTAINWSRKETTRRARTEEYCAEVPAAVVDAPDAGDPRLEWLYRRIAKLEPIDRSLTLLLLEGHSYREMSITLGLSESNVGVRINRIKKKLSRQLEQERAT